MIIPKKKKRTLKMTHGIRLDVGRGTGQSSVDLNSKMEQQWLNIIRYGILLSQVPFISVAATQDGSDCRKLNEPTVAARLSVMKRRIETMDV